MKTKIVNDFLYAMNSKTNEKKKLDMANGSLQSLGRSLYRCSLVDRFYFKQLYKFLGTKERFCVSKELNRRSFWNSNMAVISRFSTPSCV